MSRHSSIEDDSGIEQDQTWIYIRIAIEDHHLQKVLKFNLDETVWNAKQKVLQVLIRELNDGLNYGLYLPPCNGRAGKFLDESRHLREYPLNGPVSYLEFKYKRRVYKAIHLVQKNLTSKINTKKFVEWIKTNQVAKVARCLEKGFDPNFHINDDETPLSSACVDLLEPRSMIMTLVNGGAHLDFRTRHGGLTSLHQSSIHCRKESIVTLLELGASPNVYDEKGLTPLYHSVLHKQVEYLHDSAYCCQLLLEDHSMVDCRDESLSTELHQACRLGLVQHVEHLLFYRANINAMNLAGNTPLHICAATNQEACIRVLLFRGADPTIVNKSNQTPYELALISQNNSIASIIQSHRTDHVVPFREMPMMNPKRRSIYFESNERHRRPSSSQMISNRSQSLPKLTSGISSHSRHTSPSNDQDYPPHHPSSRSSSPKSFSVHSDHGLGSECTSHLSSHSPNTNPSNYSYQRKRLYAAAPGRKSMCIKSYQSQAAGELNLEKGDIVEILSVGEQGFLEGRCQEMEGWFPSHHVQDIRVFNNGEMTDDDTIVISRDALSALMINNDCYQPRTVVLQRGKKGFGFVLRGCRVVGTSFQPTASFPALQFLDSIEKGSNAEKAGLKQHDYVLEINGVNVISMPHEECVHLIKRAGNTLALKVVTASPSMNVNSNNPSTSNSVSQSLPYRRKVVSSLSRSSKKPLLSFYESSPLPCAPQSLILQRKEHPTILDELDRTLEEYEYGSVIIPPSNSSENFSSILKPIQNGSASVRSKSKPIVPERDSSLYDCFPSTNNGQIYQTFRPLRRGSTSSAVSVPNLVALNNARHNSNSSSNEADEEFSSSSMNSNNQLMVNGTEDNGIGIYMTPSLAMSSTNMSTFKSSTTVNNVYPSKPSEIKRRSNHRKQIYAALNYNQNPSTTVIPENETSSFSNVPPPPPPPPPLPTDFTSTKKESSPRKEKLVTTNISPDFQGQIEQAKSRLKKVNVEMNLQRKESPQHQQLSSAIYSLAEVKNIIIEDRTNIHEFPPPPSPTTIHRPIHSSITDPRLDANFSSVIAQRAAAAKARRHENLTELEYQSNGLPPSTTFFNHCVTTNRIRSNLSTNNPSSQLPSSRFSATANQLLENLKYRRDSSCSINSLQNKS